MYNTLHKLHIDELAVLNNYRVQCTLILAIYMYNVYVYGKKLMPE